MDRQVFGAKTSMTNVDLPLAFMPDDIRAWLDRGWRLGSYTVVYEGAVGVMFATDSRRDLKLMRVSIRCERQGNLYE